MSDDEGAGRQGPADDTSTGLRGVGAVIVVIAVLVTVGVIRYGPRATLIWAAVVLSVLAMVGACAACVHLWLIAVRSRDSGTRLEISLALFSGLIIGLAVWVPQQALEGKLEGVIEQAQRGNRESQPDQQFTDLSGEDLTDSSLSSTNFTGSDLRETDLEGSALIATDFTEAKLDDADLTATNLQEATLVDAMLTNATLDQARLDDADLSGADLEGASLVGAVLRDAELGGASLAGSNLSGADLEGANVGEEDLRSATLDEFTRCPDGSTAAIQGDSYECSVPPPAFAIETEFDDGGTIPPDLTCDVPMPRSPRVGWSGAPEGSEMVMAFTRGDTNLWLVVLPFATELPVPEPDGPDDSRIVVRDYTPPCPPAPTPQAPTTTDPDGQVALSESSTQTYSLRLFVLPEPLPRDAEGNLLESADVMLERTQSDAADVATVTGQYTRNPMDS